MKARETGKGNINIVMTKEEAKFLHKFLGNTSNAIVEGVIGRKLTDEEKHEEVTFRVFIALDNLKIEGKLA